MVTGGASIWKKSPRNMSGGNVRNAGEKLPTIKPIITAWNVSGAGKYREIK